MDALPTFDDVRAASERLSSIVHRTPVVTSATVDAELGCQVFFKCENLQKIGAFKARGACNALLELASTSAGDAAIRAGGVVTHSSGNHAAALAYAAQRVGVACAVVMPNTAPSIKVRAVEGYGAEVIPCDASARESTCARVAEDRGATVIHPFENYAVIAGQGTVALELIEQVDHRLDAVIAPVGGGGLMAGTTLSMRALLPDALPFGAEPEAVDDAARSMQSGVRQPRVESPTTWADGLLTGLGEPNFSILRDGRVTVLTVTDAELLAAARFHLERMKLVVEPSAAVVLAALRRHRERFEGLRVGAILSGGNTDFRWLGASAAS